MNTKKRRPGRNSAPGGFPPFTAFVTSSLLKSSFFVNNQPFIVHASLSVAAEGMVHPQAQGTLSRPGGALFTRNHLFGHRKPAFYLKAPVRQPVIKNQVLIQAINGKQGGQFATLHNSPGGWPEQPPLFNRPSLVTPDEGLTGGTHHA